MSRLLRYRVDTRWRALEEGTARWPLPGRASRPARRQRSPPLPSACSRPWPAVRLDPGGVVGAGYLAPEAWRRLHRVAGRVGDVDRRAGGPRGIMVIAQQHGNEYVVSNGAVELIRDLSSGSASSRAIREALTVTVVPRVNVDGFEAPVQDASGNTPPWRENFDPFCLSSCPAFYQAGRGYDINRYHSYLLDHPEDDPNTPAVDQNPVP